MSDPYCYSGSSVLKNLENIRDQDELDRYERFMTAQRMREPTPQIDMSPEGYKQLHHHICQDVYEWAGKIREVDMGKDDSFF